MIPRIKSVTPLENYILHVVFDDDRIVLYDVKDDMQTMPAYDDLRTIPRLFRQVSLMKVIPAYTGRKILYNKYERIVSIRIKYT